jgi:hypothetical protein
MYLKPKAMMCANSSQRRALKASSNLISPYLMKGPRMEYRIAVYANLKPGYFPDLQRRCWTKPSVFNGGVDD